MYTKNINLVNQGILKVQRVLSIMRMKFSIFSVTRYKIDGVVLKCSTGSLPSSYITHIFDVSRLRNSKCFKNVCLIIIIIILLLVN